MPFSYSARAPAVACAAALIAVFTTSTAISAPLPPSDASLAALRSAVREAWSRHPAAEAVEQTLAAAEARAVASSRPLYNPDLELAYDDEGPEQTAVAGMALTLDLSGKRRARTIAGQADLVLAEAEATLRRSGFAQQWLQAWTEYGSARERVRIGNERLALMQRFADLAERQLTVGDISSLERDLALLARDEAEAEQATLLADAAAATEAYRAVGGDLSRSTDIAQTSGGMRSNAATPIPNRRRNSAGGRSSSGVLRSRSVFQKVAESTIAATLPTVANTNSEL